MGNLEVAPADAWDIGQLRVSLMWLDETWSLSCNFYLMHSAQKNVKAQQPWNLWVNELWATKTINSFCGFISLLKEAPYFKRQMSLTAAALARRTSGGSVTVLEDLADDSSSPMALSSCGKHLSCISHSDVIRRMATGCSLGDVIKAWMVFRIGWCKTAKKMHVKVTKTSQWNNLKYTFTNTYYGKTVN